MTLFWLIALVVFLAVEAATVGLTSIYFAAGALAALISASFAAPVWLQVAWFLVVSGVTLYFTRPLAKKYLNARRVPTNADRLIGTVCVVSEDVDNVIGRGAVLAGGKVWTARSLSGAPIPKGTMVKVAAIEGVKLIVEPEGEGAPSRDPARESAPSVRQ